MFRTLVEDTRTRGAGPGSGGGVAVAECRSRVSEPGVGAGGRSDPDGAWSLNSTRTPCAVERPASRIRPQVPR
ncbi:hypothetical protein CG51_16360 [Haematobacter missouriensis]|uniref:Uncharacterized protein n=1 Tax=Haematobacter missouriensis TaxID=366616 RepID=A0A212AYH5_9RHOB|nr:hypothetical protein [Haematobacter missouriensis]KFI33192.1 hypothetical protein CG51_16360 [Haematobacter missouriensis]OWJ79772.1 hypothetical protein CDV53_00385 [Haematobacter missouriensis]OWJ86521.1 hypothetical protein CDV52_00760 [Haematobacter missouriensis]